MSAKKYGVIFDCDGTLVNSLDLALQSFNYALKVTGEAPRTPAEIKRYFGSAADRIFLQLLGNKEKALRAFEHFLDHQSNLAGLTHLHEGVREMLDQFQAHDVPLGIVTGRHARDLEIVLKPHRLADYFITLVADNQLPKSKPAPDGLLLAAEKMGLEPGQTLYIGDSPMDMKAAQAAGAMAVAALWDPLAHKEEMQQENPAFLARHPRDIWNFFAKISGISR